MTFGSTDLRVLRRAAFPKDALAAPPGICPEEADLTVPFFALSKEVLAQRLRELALTEPRTRLVAEFPDLDQSVFEQRWLARLQND